MCHLIHDEDSKLILSQNIETDSRTKTGSCFSPKTSRPTLGPRQEVFLSQNIQTDSRNNQVTHLMGTGKVFPEVKRPRREANHLPLSSVEIKNKWLCIYSAPHTLSSHAQGHRTLIIFVTKNQIHFL